MSYWTNNLWGNRFYNAETKKWTNKSRNDDNSENKRGFCLYIMEPILELYRAIMNDDKKKYEKMMKKLDIKLTPDEA